MREPTLLEQTRRISVQALALSVQEWNELGDGEDPSVSTPTDLEQCVERITSLLVVRVVGVISSDLLSYQQDLSTSGICRKALIDGQPWYPNRITLEVVDELRSYVRFILENYRDLPFHNFQHAYHVVVSANKLLELMLTLDSDDFLDGRPPPAFGLRHDSIALLALVFAALIHDVDHKGISNRQLVMEEHLLALSYNDISINEQHSLFLAFDELLKDRYDRLRTVMFPQDIDYRFFRSTVVNAVLSTDIASPERAQLNKSKWKEGFALEPSENPDGFMVPRRGSMVSDISMPRVHASNRRGTRRGSVDSLVSDVTFDSYSKMMRNRSSPATTQVVMDDRNGRAQDNRRIVTTNASFDDDSYIYHVKNVGRRNYVMEDSFASSIDEESVLDSVKDSVMGNYKKSAQTPSPTGSSGTSHNTPTNNNCSSNDNSNGSNGAKNRNNSMTHSEVSNSSYGAKNRNNSMAQSEVPNSGYGAKNRNNSRAHSEVSNSGYGAKNRNNSMAQSEVSNSGYSKWSKMRRRHSTQGALARGEETVSRGEDAITRGESFGSFAQESIALAHKRQEGMPASRDKKNLENFRKKGTKQPKKKQDTSSSSISLTPPSSDEEWDYPVRALLVPTKTEEKRKPRTTTSMRSPNISRRASTGGAVPGRLRGNRRIDEATESNYTRLMETGGFSKRMKSKMSRRASSGAYSEVSVNFRKRLGILRGMDFSGESIEAYSRGSIGGTSLVTGVHGEEVFLDEPDELRASVVIEVLLRAADVAHSLQGWSNMAKWSSRLFRELSVAHQAGRGPDPGPGWFDNQAKALENYVLPLSLQLDETGVFGEFIGAIFAQQVEENRDQWLIKGFDLTASLRKESQ